MRRPLYKWLLVGIFVIVVVSVVGWVRDRTAVLGKAFAQVQRGDSPTRVAELFSERPNVTTDIETNIDWDDVWHEGSGVKCVREFHFCPPFSICGEEWVVGFDEQSNAVAKYHMVSP